MAEQPSMKQQWATSQLDGANSSYLEALYEQFLTDPNSVEPSWRGYFTALNGGADEANHSQLRDAFIEYAKHPHAGAAASPAQGRKFAAVEALVNAYRSFGHFHAKTDPLGLQTAPEVDELTLAFHGLSDGDLGSQFELTNFNSGASHTLKEVVTRLQKNYCGSIGFEFMHVATTAERAWLREQIEAPRKALSAEQKHWLLQQLVAADGLEKYLGMRFVGQKRFSLEGGDALVPMINHLVQQSSQLGTKEIIIGMAHRGRLNVLVNVIGKSPESLFAEFEGKHAKQLLSGDVKYHNGFSSNVKTASGTMHLAVAFNPSHLEIVSPVVEGSVRARQTRLQDTDRNHVMAIQVHGDSAFCGQGVVMETFSRSQAAGYRTGGSIHIVLNNQVGFTTNLREETRSSYYATDIAKMVDAPVFHVNSEDPEAVLFVTHLALAYRMQFNKDVVIDLVCYRRHGHNEADEPAATQPVMYQIVKKMPVPAKGYADQLAAKNELEADVYNTLTQQYKKALEEGKPVAANVILRTKDDGHNANWAPYQGVPWDVACSTKMKKAELIKIAKQLDELPKDFTPQRQVGKMLEERVKMTAGTVPMNWGYAEVLAYATLLKQGYFVRLSGEDTQRGTFAHRHAVLHDNKTGETYAPLSQVDTKQGHFEVINSILSEEAVMAFEYGYASSAPKGLVVWEAQFGDFANGAQVIIDQFICSAEEKWGRLCGLALFLPHGQEGMGAEHSSARLGRFLQLCAHQNMQICVPTTPAQIYHLIRRQVIRPYRKPLIVMTPKSLLRHPLVTSTMDELADGEYQVVIGEIDKLAAKQVKRVILCQGKVYYDLLQQRREAKRNDVAIIRLEQLYPFPDKALKAVMKPYAHVKDIIWCQEEPENQGAWYRIQHDIRKLLSEKQTLNYAGREAFASPAVGYPSLHHEQQTKLVNEALGLKPNRK